MKEPSLTRTVELLKQNLLFGNMIYYILADAQARRGPPPQHEAAAPATGGSDGGAAQAAAHGRAVRGAHAVAGDADAELQPGGATEDATTNEP